MQLDLSFSEPITTAPLALARQTETTCAFGSPSEWGTVHALGWFGEHHCFYCYLETITACHQFDLDVQAGKYDADGYTPAERRIQARKNKS